MTKNLAMIALAALVLAGCNKPLVSTISAEEGGNSLELECYGWCRIMETSLKGIVYVERQKTRGPVQ